MYAFIGDLHLGVRLPQIDFMKSLDKFLGLIKEHKEECHCIFVVGDLFDKKLSVEESKFAAIFLVNLVMNNCGRNGRQHIPVHFIHGTYSHDNEQYEMYMPLLEKLPNTEVFYTKHACVGTLHNDVKVLYLPQEYRGSIDYSQAFKEKYDLIVGHGPIASEVYIPCKSTQYEILHSVELLGNISKLCVFGHFHGYTDFGNNVYYTGPWLRWKYGEDIDRVFFFANDEFRVETVPNEIAMEFITVPIYSCEELREWLSKNITSPHRFVIHCKSDELAEYHAIMNVNKNNQFVKYQIMSEHVEKDEVSGHIDNDQVKTIVEPVPALIEYVKDKYKIDVTEEIKDYESKINRDSKPE